MFNLLLPRTLLVPVFCLVCSAVFSQAAPNLEEFKAMPPSPEAQAFHKYGNYPVDHVTGVPKIEIPLYEINAGKLTVPVTLNYHLGGIKISEHASSVGLGWSLSAGGMLSRAINQIEDEAGNGFFNRDHPSTAQIENFPADPIPDYPGYLQAYQTIQSIFFNSYDAESDDYTYSACNKLSGEFVYDINKNLQKTTYNNDIVNRYQLGTNQYGYEVVSDDGTKYQFYETEKVKSPYNAGYCPSSWLLTKIISSDGVDEINFEYNKYPGLIYATPSQTIEYVTNGMTHIRTDYTRMEYDQTVLISKIRYRGGYIMFNYEGGRKDMLDYRLRAVDIYTTDEAGAGTLVKEYQLKHSYFESTPNPSRYQCRLKLDEIQNYDQAGKYVNSHSFVYNTDNGIPEMANTSVAPPSPGAQFSQDYWGFPNGAGNGHLLPMLFGLGDVANGRQADREVNEAMAQTASLQQINYPTGGYTRFIMESNRDNYGELYGGLRVKKMISTSSPNDIPVVKEYSYLNGYSNNDRAGARYWYEQNMAAPALDCPPGDHNTLLCTHTSRPYAFANSIIPLTATSSAPIQYYNVTETTDDGKGGKQRTEYSYELDYDRSYNIQNHLFSQYNYAVNTRYDNYYAAPRSWSSGLLKSTAFSKWDGSTWKPVKMIINEYTPKKENVINTGMKVNEKLQRGDNDPPYYYHFDHPGYADFFYFDVLVDGGIKKLTKTEEVEYDDNGNTHSTVTNYSYDGNDHLYPTGEVTTDSKGGTLTTTLKYPKDLTLTGDEETARQQLVALNNISPILNKKMERNGQQVSDLWTYYKVFDYANHVYPHIVRNQFEAGGPYAEYFYNQYDTKGNVAEVQKANDIPVAYIWSYNKLFPVAEVKNASISQVAYTSFEANDLGGWTWKENMQNSLMTSGVTGNVSGRGSIYKLNLPNGTYIVTAWGTEDYPVIVNSLPGEELRVIGNNVLFRWVLTNPVNVNVTGAMMDEVRLYPQGSEMITRTYEPEAGVTSECDVNNRVTYYEYDSFKRLIAERDEQRNIIKTYCYRFGTNSSFNCNGTDGIFYSARQEKAFSRNDCGLYAFPGGTTYVVPYGKYTSTSSQKDADDQATNDMNANGQNFANGHSQCNWYNAELRKDFYKQGCAANEIGLPHTVIVFQGTYYSTVSPQIVKDLAQAEMDAKGQNLANTYGRCIRIDLPFVRFQVENVDPVTNRGTLVVRFYSDLAGTVSLSVSNMTVKWKTNTSSGDHGSTEADYSAVVNGSSWELQHGAPLQYYDDAIQDYWYVSYYLQPGNYTDLD